MAVVVVLALVGAVLPSAAFAADRGGNSEAGIGAALGRIADGTYTAADIALIESVPEIAAKVPDPRPSAAISGELARQTTSNAGINGCTNLESYTQLNSITGAAIYRLNSRTKWCWDGSKVTDIYGRSGWFTNIASGVYFREWVVNEASGEGHFTGHSDRQALMELCLVKYGCYDTKYPFINHTIKGNGTWSSSKGSG